jgi:hypothetical protein
MAPPSPDGPAAYEIATVHEGPEVFYYVRSIGANMGFWRRIHSDAVPRYANARQTRYAEADHFLELMPDA